MANPVVHWEIGGPNGEQLQEFYRDLFGWKVQVMEEMGNYGLVDHEDEGIGGGIVQTGEGAPPTMVTIYIQVDDLQAYLNKAESLGGKTITPPLEISDEIGSAAMFSDPQGNLIGLFQSA